MTELHPIQRENIGKAIGVTVHPKFTHAVALAGLAKHYFGAWVHTNNFSLIICNEYGFSSKLKNSLYLI